VLPHSGRTYEGFSPGKDEMPGSANESFLFNEGLFDLRRDPGERFNVYQDYPEVVEQLMKMVEEARQDMSDDLMKNPGQHRRPIGRVK
jgi:hypothetical protein